jgi:hypothetical protein
VADRVQKTFVAIVGPPAVGKMTVGIELRDITGIPLFHNHLSIEAVLPVFEYGSEPFTRLVSDFRFAMFEEVARSDLPGLIYTWVWAFDRPGDVALANRLREIFGADEWRMVFVELQADQETRLRRNESAGRLAAKRSKRDVVASRERLVANDEKYQLSSNGDFPFPNHLLIDNTDLSARDTAERIVEHFGLPRRTSY